MVTELQFVASTLHSLIQIETCSSETSEMDVTEENKEYAVSQNPAFPFIEIKKAYTSAQISIVAYPFLSYQSPPPDSEFCI